MGKKEVSFEGVMELGKLITYLEDLAASFKSGTVVVQHGDEYVALTPEPVVEMEVEAEQKKDKEKFTLELSWKKDEQVVESGREFKISSEKPAEAPETEDKPEEA